MQCQTQRWTHAYGAAEGGGTAALRSSLGPLQLHRYGHGALLCRRCRLDRLQAGRSLPAPPPPPPPAPLY